MRSWERMFYTNVCSLSSRNVFGEEPECRLAEHTQPLEGRPYRRVRLVDLEAKCLAGVEREADASRQDRCRRLVFGLQRSDPDEIQLVAGVVAQRPDQAGRSEQPIAVADADQRSFDEIVAAEQRAGLLERHRSRRIPAVRLAVPALEELSRLVERRRLADVRPGEACTDDRGIEPSLP